LGKERYCTRAPLGRIKSRTNHLQGSLFTMIHLNMTQLALKKHIALFLGIAFFQICQMGIGPSCHAAPDKPFVVKGLQVDVKDTSAVEARKKALAMGQRKAFVELLNLIATPENSSASGDLDALGSKIAATFSDDQIAAHVLDFEIVDEKNSKTRYLATLTYRLNRTSIEKLISEASHRIVKASKEAVLILPLLEKHGEMLLWQDENQWKQAWDKKHMSFSLIPFTLPLGDLQDVQELTPSQALEGSFDSLEKIAKRYETPAGALVVYAKYFEEFSKEEGLMVPHITIEFMYGLPSSQGARQAITLSGEPGGSVEELLNKGVDTVLDTLNRDWKRGELLPHDKKVSLTANCKLNSPKSWFDIKEKLASLRRAGCFLSYDVLTLSTEKIRLRLHHRGCENLLKQQAELVGLRLSSFGAEWSIEELNHKESSAPADMATLSEPVQMFQEAKSVQKLQEAKPVQKLQEARPIHEVQHVETSQTMEVYQPEPMKIIIRPRDEDLIQENQNLTREVSYLLEEE